jgi:alkanesulfonate monooxygenase SsuD/methylene tetrahydromethanopterin reductase-like flavin-dependent oxidoreductase (luciferase family)
VSYRSLEFGKEAYADLKAACASYGRDPEQMKITTLMYPVVGETKAEAEDKKAAYDTLPNDTDSLSLLSEALNFDFSRKGLDEPFTDEEIAGIAGMHAMRDRVLQMSGNPNPTPRDFMHYTGRGKLEHPWVGGPKEMADMFEEWFVGRACDGFVIGPTHIPGSFEGFTRLVVPELQRRGLFRTEYTGATLRDHLGLAYPTLGHWRH